MTYGKGLGKKRLYLNRGIPLSTSRKGVKPRQFSVSKADDSAEIQTSSSEVKERVELYLYSPSGPSWPVLG